MRNRACKHFKKDVPPPPIKTLHPVIGIQEMESKHNRCNPTYNYKKESNIQSCSHKRVAHKKATTSCIRPVVFALSQVANQPPHSWQTNTLLIIKQME